MKFKNVSDNHTHSKYSHDGKETIDALCTRAKELGLLYYTITDHCEIENYEMPEFVDYRKRLLDGYKDMTAKKEIYPFFLSGIELAQPLHNLEVVDKLFSDKNYDFVIGSIHSLENYADFAYWEDEPYLDGTYWSESKLSKEDALRQYLLDMLNIAKWGKIDTLAHLTYPLRYLTNSDGSRMNFDAYNDIVRKIFKTIIENGVALEINTSGLRQAIGEVLPNKQFLKLYKEMGGELLTIGSDAHCTEDLGKGLCDGLELAQELGFKYYSVYINRKPKMIKI